MTGIVAMATRLVCRDAILGTKSDKLKEVLLNCFLIIKQDMNISGYSDMSIFPLDCVKSHLHITWYLVCMVLVMSERKSESDKGWTLYK